MHTRTTTAVVAAVLLLTALTACGSETPDGEPGGPATLSEEQLAEARAATGLPDTTPEQEAAFVAALDSIDKDIAHGEAEKAVSRGRSQCQTIHNWPDDEEKQVDQARQRFTSPKHPEGRAETTAARINAAALAHLCPDF
ncbi:MULTISPECIES: DUF732 domain-containing protein [unclassified Streptomyces]|uniref:DUF732 domain-containing protein n=1 Tax=unclassified Streptomyces TaxID=2593676 RepID=UPI0001C18F95|nr:MULTISPECIES: DUF732 domain-containing protein [unclassified Streptomyces]AEN08137.1 hypothetical protein SACTE_0187 [Streptomyces sp. SirexAA-E]MYR68360.1 DUF732 domain-containing protein [Streptomyces sp. SID4939]MYS02697.1 DUF732 domain-containing protein [Streptomyces sp. SID4940]MYT66716.1 DUF732 domain-containing protein [Streptomyces sp. SID8357]MYT83637.1 DUF732 domain-containing protein [Streptomyces sp. SID8360]